MERYMYILSLPFLLLLIAFLSGRYKSPLYIYYIFLSFYPIVVCLYQALVPVSFLPDVVPLFSKEVYDKFYQLAFFSILLMAITDFLLTKISGINRRKYTPPNANKSYCQIMKAINLSLIVCLFLFVFINKGLFIDSYIYQSLRVDDFSDKISGIIGLYNTLELFYILSLFFLIIINKERKYVIFSFVCFLVLKMLIGSRLMLVPPLLLYLWVMVNDSESRKTIPFRKIVIYLVLVLVLFVAANYFRSLKGDSLGFIGAIEQFTYEFLFATISSLYSINYVHLNNSPGFWGMLFDSIKGVIPSFIYGGAEIKKSMMTYESWKSAIGGYRAISPVGGYYIVGQVYLWVKSSMVVYAFFISYAVLLHFSELYLKIKQNFLAKMIFAQMVFFGMVYGVRTEIWIFQKIYLQQFLLTTIIFMGFVYLIKQLLTKK
ncbi:TPA: O-antigen polysaccharide polymerase Wzy [Raoultella ornithinolytica]|uniref:O-antigen polysaccharide polymerase Wzy n=1 Tax=Raoultella ornithinolytica TaxID=54291 RepID=UPI00387340AA